MCLYIYACKIEKKSGGSNPPPLATPVGIADPAAWLRVLRPVCKLQYSSSVSARARRVICLIERMNFAHAPSTIFSPGIAGSRKPATLFVVRIVCSVMHARPRLQFKLAQCARHSLSVTSQSDASCREVPAGLFRPHCVPGCDVYRREFDADRIQSHTASVGLHRPSDG